MYIRALSPAADKEKDPYAKKREPNYQILVRFGGERFLVVVGLYECFFRLKGEQAASEVWRQEHRVPVYACGLLTHKGQPSFTHFLLHFPILRCRLSTPRSFL